MKRGVTIVLNITENIKVKNERYAGKLTNKLSPSKSSIIDNPNILVKRFVNFGS